MKQKTTIILSVLMILVISAVCRAQQAEAKLSDGTYGFYNLLAEDLGETCKAKKSHSGTVSRLQAGESDGTTIYSFSLAPAAGKKITIGMILSDSEISPKKVKRFLTDGRKVKVVARNCDGQITAVQIVSTLPMNDEP